jgi:hypothetical protein
LPRAGPFAGTTPAGIQEARAPKHPYGPAAKAIARAVANGVSGRNIKLFFWDIYIVYMA